MAAQASSQPGKQAVFDGLKQHFGAQRTGTELMMFEHIRKAHPDFHVTCSDPTKCDLVGYAMAGHAKITKDGGELFDVTRSYVAPVPRREGTGKLKDQNRFSRWKLTWKDAEYIIYEVKWAEYMSPFRVYYVLSPRKQGDAQTSAATDELLFAVGAWTTELHKEIYVFDDAHWSKDKELWASVQGASWDEVILNPVMKANLIEDVQGFFDNKSLYKSLAVPWKRGLILHGVPGNGKTISLKALINALGARPDPVPSLYVKSFDACQGPKYSIRQIFSHARVMAPCLLIFEDLDSLVTDKTRSYFLNEVDGLESNDGILMIGSTNHLNSLDPAISKRPSRFDRKYHFKIPNEEERVAYCQFWRKKLLESHLVDFHEDLCTVIAKLSEGFSFAYMKELFVIALLTIARGGGVEEEEVQGEDAKSSTDSDPVIVEHETVPVEKDTAVDADKNADATEKDMSGTKKKRTLPEVDIPEHLQDNHLLKVLKAQLKMLLDEMENIDADEAPAKKAADDENDTCGDYSQQLMMLARQNARARE
ncbi:P-loop containing nucleoside triphosphate hydrolase protein [Leptodontidium sp. 2 PMI_412]|nr:P-loop containing nucleoside triphosphate hydrolase protein [Leptodontidium sp. 2 PMI_412]